jgi:biotin transport system substrate-specific component
MKIKTRNMILVSFFAALTAVGAFIKVPIGPVPITLQFLFTALAAVLLGPKLGALSQLLYVAIGLFGIPVFTQGGGPAYIFKPTFGYLLGYIAGAYVIGLIVSKYKEPKFLQIFIACLAGLVVIYAIGVPYLYLILNYVSGVHMDFSKALTIGCIVFIPGDVVKSILTALIGVKVIPVLKKI